MTTLIKSSIFLQEATQLEIVDKNSLQYADILIERGRKAEEIIERQQAPNIQKWEEGKKAAVAEKNNLLSPFQEGLKILKAKVIAFQDNEHAQKLLTFQNNGVSPELMLAVPMIESRTVTRRKKTDWEIINIDQIKDEYKVLAVDEKKINAIIAQLEANNLNPSIAENLVGGIQVIKTSTAAFKPRAKES